LYGRLAGVSRGGLGPERVGVSTRPSRNDGPFVGRAHWGKVGGWATTSAAGASTRARVDETVLGLLGPHGRKGGPRAQFSGTANPNVIGSNRIVFREGLASETGITGEVGKSLSPRGNGVRGFYDAQQNPSPHAFAGPNPLNGFRPRGMVVLLFGERGGRPARANGVSAGRPETGLLLPRGAFLGPGRQRDPPAGRKLEESDKLVAGDGKELAVPREERGNLGPGKGLTRRRDEEVRNGQGPKLPDPGK